LGKKLKNSEKKLKRAEADSEGIVGSLKKAKKKKGTLINRPQKKILRHAWRKMCDRIKAEVGRKQSTLDS
jgi:hypothetical protein